MLTLEQENFLIAHNIDMSSVLNAQGMSTKEYKKIMKQSKKIIAYNVSPCKKEGHTMRTRAGHCCQCDTSRIEFQKRNDNEGIVYIASSEQGGVIKIGFTHDFQNRQHSLNRTKYAGFNDWLILMTLCRVDAGRIEHKTQALLYDKAVCSQYLSGGKMQNSYETFKCTYLDAKNMMLNVIKENRYEVKEINYIVK